MTKLFPIILIFLNLCAAVTYFTHGDIKHGIYWIAAAVLTTTVTI